MRLARPSVDAPSFTGLETYICLRRIRKKRLHIPQHHLMSCNESQVPRQPMQAHSTDSAVDKQPRTCAYDECGASGRREAAYLSGRMRGFTLKVTGPTHWQAPTTEGGGCVADVVAIPACPALYLEAWGEQTIFLFRFVNIFNVLER